jgi:anti-sigma factor RsiW
MVERLLARHRRRRLLRGLAWGSAACVLLVSIFLVRQAGSAEPFEQFAELAVDAHRRYTSGTLALDLSSEDGPAVSAWLGDRLPFQITLPRYPAQPGAEKRYTLVGARLLPFDHHSLAYVAYKMKGEPISLLITSSASVSPSGGQVYRSGGLRFHFLSRNGQRLIAWSDRGLSYALVSSVQASGAASCVVCHGGEGERPKFEGLVPSTH